MVPRGGARPGAGRKAMEEPRKNHTMKFTDTEWDKLEKLAKKAGCVTPSGKANVSEYVRKTCLVDN